MINLHGIPLALVGVLAFSLAGPSFAGGLMYHHSSKEVVAIHP